MSTPSPSRAAPSKSTVLCSMTGFSSVEGEIFNRKIRVETKSLNHRFLDLKIRLPRELASIEQLLRLELQSRFSRGAIELKVEWIPLPPSQQEEVIPDLELAKRYHDALLKIKTALGLTESVLLKDILSFPDLFPKAGADLMAKTPDQIWSLVRPTVEQALERLHEMRKSEGATLASTLLEAMKEMRSTSQFLRKRRGECEELIRDKVKERVQAVFQNYPIDTSIPSKELIESRMAQELALIFDRTDVEEELNRLDGHLEQFEKTLRSGSPIGRKLDFILQELNRETNTLGNKAQDYSISDEVVQLKVRIEQLREQSMNIE